MLRDLSLAFRQLRRAPGFAAAAVLTLALGIGANTAAFSVVNGVLLKPLAYPDSDRLVSVYSTDPAGNPFYGPSYLDFRDLREASTGTFEGMAFMRSGTLLLRGREGAEPVNAAHVSEGFFGVLGVRPALGRLFAPDEERPGGPRVIVLKYDLWQRSFGGDPAVVGRTLDFAEGAYTVVGVLPRGADYPTWANAFAPAAGLIASNGGALAKRDFRVDNRVVARLRAGLTIERSTNDLAAAARRLGDTYPEDKGWTAQAYPLRDDVIGNVRPQMLVLFAAVALVLLVACANVANLMLVRATARSREIAVRAALGAGRWRAAREMLSESIAIGLAGGALGALLAVWGVHLLRGAAAANLPRIDEVQVDGRVLAATAAASLLTALAFGLAPALFAAAVSPGDALKEGGARGGGHSVGRRRLRSLFVGAEIALAVVLLVGAGLLARSFARLRAADPGFDPERLLVLRVGPSEAKYDTPEKLREVYRRIGESVAAVPGVRSVAFVNHMPMTGTSVITPVRAEGRTPDSGDVALFRAADARHFATIGQPLASGRVFSDADMTPTSRALVVNETFVRRYFPGLGAQQAVGRRVTAFKQAVGRPDYNQPVEGEIVGVVGDTHLRSVDDQLLPEVFVPFPVNPWRSAFITARTAGDPAALVSAVRRAVRDVDPDIPTGALQPATALVAGRVADRRFNMTLLISFAASALLLAGVGIYGVLAYSVASRTREIGVRAALGASRRQLVSLFLGEGARLAAAGVLAGLALAAAATRVLQGMVFGVGTRDAATFAGAAVVLVVVAVAASLIPARRAARVQPMEALRYE